MSEEVQLKKPEQIHINCKIRRDFGGIEVEFECGYTLDLPQNIASRRSAYAGLVITLEDQFDHFVTHQLPKMKARYGGNRPDNFDHFEAEKLVLNIHNGKKQYKIVGGRWKKFGVPIYEEVLKPTGLVERMGQDTEVDLIGWKATALLLDGKAKKVTALEQV